MLLVALFEARIRRCLAALEVPAPTTTLTAVTVFSTTKRPLQHAPLARSTPTRELEATAASNASIRSGGAEPEALAGVGVGAGLGSCRRPAPPPELTEAAACVVFAVPAAQALEGW